MKQNNKEKILKIARKLFLTYGYNGISLRTIADKANVTTGAIYFHFKNKEEIYKTICMEAVDILLEKFKEGASSQISPQQKLIFTYDSFISFFYENLDYYNLLMEYKAAYNSPENSFNDEIALKMKELLKIMADMVAEGINEKVYREVDPIKVSIILASIAEGMLQYKKLGLLAAIDVTDKEFRAVMAELIGYGILHKEISGQNPDKEN